MDLNIGSYCMKKPRTGHFFSNSFSQAIGFFSAGYKRKFALRGDRLNVFVLISLGVKVSPMLIFISIFNPDRKCNLFLTFQTKLKSNPSSYFILTLGVQFVKVSLFY